MATLESAKNGLAQDRHLKYLIQAQVIEWIFADDIISRFYRVSQNGDRWRIQLV